MNEEQEYKRLVAFFSGGKGVVVAFSGGVDSSLLLTAAKDAVGDQAIGVTISSPLSCPGEIEEARLLARSLHARHLVVELDELSNPSVRANPEDRCYHCKRMRFEALFAIAKEHGISLLVEGSCTDDLDDYRPGLRAVRQLGVSSPFLDLAISKDDIRRLSRYRNITGWSRPSNSCLATRLPYGQSLDKGRLERIARAERLLCEMGFEQLRVRDFGQVAVVEVLPESVARVSDDLRQQVLSGLKALGFVRVCVDLAGYRTGSMNTGISLDRQMDD